MSDYDDTAPLVEWLRQPRWLEGAKQRRLFEAADEIEQLREALKLARKRLEYYGTIGHRRHFDHDLAEIYPKIDAALNQQQGKEK